MKKSGSLFTIGYQGHSPQTYLRELKRAGVTLLCDVRANPLSRKPGFSKRALAKHCNAEGIEYEHLPELGIPSKMRKGLETDAEFEKLFRYYKNKILPRQGAALRRIQEWIQQGENVALTCYEKSPQDCHRLHTAAALKRRARNLKLIEHL